MFCQSCGARNAVDARFCNMCGTGLSPPSAQSTLRSPEGRAPAGSPEGRAPVGPPLGHLPTPYEPGASSVSLQSIGVQSSGRTWALIGGLVVLLLLLGGVGGWLTTRSSAAPGADVPPDAIAAPMEIGTPTSVGEELPSHASLPQGVEPPTDVAQRVANARRAARAASTNGSAHRDVGGTAADPSTGPVTGAATGTSTHAATGTSTRPAAGATSSTATHAATGTATGTPTAAATGTATGTAVGASTDPTSGTAAGTDSSNTVPLDEPVEERDLMFDLYLTQVRRFIRTYYATRAQSCFDHASRNNEGIRGTVVITFTISADGTIPVARATRNTTGDDALGGCLVSQVRAWDLPDPPGGELELAMPFSR